MLTVQKQMFIIVRKLEWAILISLLPQKLKETLSQVFLVNFEKYFRTVVFVVQHLRVTANVFVCVCACVCVCVCVCVYFLSL